MKILLITGGRHPYHLSTPIISKYLRESGHNVKVSRSAKELYRVPLLGYDAVLLNTRRGGIDEGATKKNRRIPSIPKSERNNDFSEQQKQNLKWFVESGGGLVSIHISPDSCPGWDEWLKIVGGGWVGIQQPPTYPNQTPSTHPPFSRFEVKVTDKDHPCTLGVDNFFTDDELYYKLQLPENDYKIFIEADYEGESHPLGWSTNYHKGKTIYIALGHTGISVDNPGFLKILDNSIKFVSSKD